MYKSIHLSFCTNIQNIYINIYFKQKVTFSFEVDRLLVKIGQKYKSERTNYIRTQVSVKIYY